MNTFKDVDVIRAVRKLFHDNGMAVNLQLAKATIAVVRSYDEALPVVITVKGDDDEVKPLKVEPIELPMNLTEVQKEINMLRAGHMPKDYVMSQHVVRGLRALGYCVTSAKYGLISRIDREDWKEYCTKGNYPISADWYRRCLSKDTIEIGPSRAKRFVNSGESQIEYKAKNW